MVAKQAMGTASKRPVLGLTSALCLLAFTLVGYVGFTSNDALLESWKNLSSLGGIAASKEEVEPLNYLLRRLVRGEDQAELEATGFSCQSNLHTDVCLSSKPVRVTDNGLTLHIPLNTTSIARRVQPYARKEDNTAMKLITPVRILHGEADLPACNFTHNVSAIIFSSGGFTGNVFHEFNEIVIPLFLTARHFRSKVKFIITDYRAWWVDKYRRVLTHLSDYEVMNSTEGAHCFPGAVLGLEYHDNLAIDVKEIPRGHSIFEFRKFLREAYDLKFAKVQDIKKPVLLFISRPETRKILNEDHVILLMEELGFQVVIATPELMLNLDRFAEVVNSCSVMVGVHGAGFTNELFLPHGSVVIQIVPLGLDWASTTYYGEPASAMGLQYLEYKIEPEESSLYDAYGPKHPVITDPMSVFKHGYYAARAVYVDGQNVKINLVKFRKTLSKAKRLVGQ